MDFKIYIKNGELDYQKLYSDMSKIEGINKEFNRQDLYSRVLTWFKMTHKKENK